MKKKVKFLVKVMVWVIVSVWVRVESYDFDLSVIAIYTREHVKVYSDNSSSNKKSYRRACPRL